MFSDILLLLKQKLLMPVSFFGINIKLWILIPLGVSFAVFASITILCLCCTLCRAKKPSYDCSNNLVPNNTARSRSSESTKGNQKSTGHIASPRPSSGTHIIDVEPRASTQSDGWSRSFSLLAIEIAANELRRDNVIGHGDCGTVYHGVLLDGTKVAIKKLLVNSCGAEEFVAQVEEVGHVRHKNLVNLLGYSIEGSQRMLVYEFVENRSLHYWLHQCPDQLSPLSWPIRMDIIYGIAKGLEYLHHGIEQRIIHRALKSCNVMLDQQWNPKLTDFGVAKLFSPQWGFILMEALGYVAPEKDHNSAYNFTEKHDVYSFGILTLEIITGRAPIDRSLSQANVIEWVKSMVASGNMGIVADSKLGEAPFVKDLKRILLIALRCMDSDEEHRPSIRDVTLMLQPHDLLLDDDDLYFLC